MIKDLNKCHISVEDDRSVKVVHEQYGTFDVTQSLMFGDDISLALEDHSPTASWWAAMLAEERFRLKTFQEGLHLRYMAHCRYFAKLAIRGLGDRETLESVRDYVSILFSREKSSLVQSVLHAVWYGHLVTQHTTATAVKKHLDTQTPVMVQAAKAEQERVMYSWEKEHDITYDDMMLLELDITKNTEVLKHIVENFAQRGVLLSSLAADKRAEMQSMGNSRINTLNKSLVDQVKS